LRCDPRIAPNQMWLPMSKYLLSLEPSRAALPGYVFNDQAAAQGHALLMAKRLALAGTPTPDERVVVLDEHGRVVHEESLCEADPLAWLR
jgi:hypothetical protein